MAAALEGHFQDIEDQEEGEIVDESEDSDQNREFESISDNSLESLPSIGKCDSSKNHSPDISSDTEEKYLWKKHFKRKMKVCGKKKMRYHHHHHHHHHSRLRRHHRRHRSSSNNSSSSGVNRHAHRHHRHQKFLFNHSDSSTEEYMVLDKSILKAAVRVNNSELHKNSLSSRLRAMAMLDNKSPELQEVDKSMEEKDNQESGKEDDNELIQLRLAALRTAILNKKKFRKKRKLKEVQNIEDEVVEISDTLENKENDEDMNPNKKPCLEMTSDAKVEETKTTEMEINNPPDDDDEDVLRALLLASMSKKITRETKDLVVKESQNFNFHKHKFHYNMKKPFFNSINKINNKLVKPPVMVRPLLHTKVSPLIINLKDDSESDEDVNKSMTIIEQSKTVENNFIENTVEKFLREERAKIEAQNNKKADKSEVFEKSCVKLLPKSKQIEYQNLLQKLRNAQKVPQKTKKVQNRINKEANHVIKNSKKLVRVRPANNQSLHNRGGGGGSVEVPDLVKDARDLQKVIREIQSNGRLQMQAKYTSLTPIVKKINETSIERKKYDKEVKRLLEELTEAKKKLRGSHIHFKMYVRELIGKKEEIDKKPYSPAVEKESMVTSTPLKKAASLDTFESTPIIDSKDNSNKENTSVSDKEYTDDSINLGDPNDIDKIYSTVPKYISPLDNTLRPDTKDPFSIMCPYDIDGSCKDTECVYKHYHE